MKGVSMDSPICPKCRKRKWINYGSTNAMDICQCLEYYQQYGWICPVCGAGNSPSSTVCPCRYEKKERS